MALKTVRIGSLPDVFQYDDGEFDSAIDTDGPIRTTHAAAAADDVVRLDDLPGGVPGNTVSSTANITDNSVVRGDGGAKAVQGSGVLIDDSDNIIVPGTVTIQTIKSGATQAAAGASTGELWKTSGHASLPDNVVMIGV